MEVEKLSLLVFNILLVLVMADFTANCPKKCKCMWEKGRKTADCSVSNFHDFPDAVDSEIQILDLSGNKLNEIKKDAFKRIGVINVKKLILRENNLETIHKSGFSGLEIMIELDLSSNKIKTLHVDTFRETLRIRWIWLSGNQIEILEDGLFNNLPFLLKVDLRDNKIATFGLKTFMNVPKLSILRLDSNRLQNLQVEALSNISSLSFLDIHENPWRCDCNLLPFRNWFIGKDLYSLPIACSQPPEVHGKLWTELDSSDFTCRNSTTKLLEKTKTRTLNNETKISCQINGNTLPEVNWVLNAQIKEGVYSYQGEVKYYLEQNNTDNKWVNLTINLCIAKNSEGENVQHLTLAIAPTIPGMIV